MNVLVSAKGYQLRSNLRALVVERIEESLQRFEDRIREVRVYLGDENGPKKGIDRTIQVVVDMDHLPLVIVKERGSDWENTLHRATDRVVESIGRSVDRQRSHSRTMSMAGNDSIPQLDA